MRLADYPRTSNLMRFSLIITLVCGSVFTHAAEPEAAAVAGLWSGDGSILEVRQVGEQLSMTLIAFKDAVYMPEEGLGEPGTARRDDNNPDPELKKRALLGLDLLSDYRWNGKRWEGKIYDPATGNNYSSRMTMEGERLKMRGYVGAPMFGRNQFFEPLEQCDEPVRQMLAVAEAKLTLCD